MFIKMLTGPYRGKVREVVFEAARDLIKIGEAQEVNFNTSDAQQQLVSAAKPAAPAPSIVSAPAAAAPKKNKRR